MPAELQVIHRYVVETPVLNPGSRCYLLGELIQDTASRYYYRVRGAKLAFVIGKSPSIHIMPCPACPDWLASQGGAQAAQDDRTRLAASDHQRKLPAGRTYPSQK